MNMNKEIIINRMLKLMSFNTDTKYSQYTFLNHIIETFKMDVNHENEVDKTITNLLCLIISYMRILQTYDSNCMVYSNNNIYYAFSQKNKPIYYTCELKEYNDLHNTALYSKYYKDVIINDYLIANDFNSHASYKDCITGNTIFHDIVIDNDISNLKKLLYMNKFVSDIKNFENDTPYDLMNLEMFKIYISYVFEHKNHKMIMRELSFQEQASQKIALLEQSVISINDELLLHKSNINKTQKHITSSNWIDLTMTIIILLSMLSLYVAMA